MELLVAFDIASDSRRRRVTTALRADGERLQRSVFAVHGTSAELLGEQLARLVDETRDVVMIWSPAGGCAPKWTVGGVSAGRSRPTHLVVE